jgi:hypothetical protein
MLNDKIIIKKIKKWKKKQPESTRVNLLTHQTYN